MQIQKKTTVEEIKKNPVLYVYKSTSCGLALEHLGLLEEHKQEKRYLLNRGGSFISVHNKNKDGPPIRFLSTREMFDLLPIEIK